MFIAIQPAKKSSLSPRNAGRGQGEGPWQTMTIMLLDHRPTSRIITVMSEGRHTDYDDSYPTCVKTNSTLRIFSDALGPEEITKVLNIEPTSAFRKGDVIGQGKLQRKTNGWFYCTEKLSNSKDTRCHLDMILAALEGKLDAVKVLHARGCKTDISTHWMSVGQGGPWLMPEQMLKLGALDIGIWWDVYFAYEDET